MRRRRRPGGNPAGMRLNFDFPVPLKEAVFLERPNRFVCRLHLPTEAGGLEEVTAHLADPGRLKELLIPGVRVLVQDHGLGLSRKHRYTLMMVYTGEGRLVSLNTLLPNRLVHRMLLADALPGFEGYTVRKREVAFGKSRIDFLLKTPDGRDCLLEVKSVTLVENRVALFPDAPTARGARHLMELTEAVRQGHEARVAFVVQRGDADAFSPNAVTDPLLATVCRSAILAGVRMHAFCFELMPDHSRFLQEIPVVIPESV
jgi:sugar fermentation stimulation protein A